MKFFKKPIIIICTVSVLIVGLVFVYKTVSLNSNKTELENAVKVKEKDTIGEEGSNNDLIADESNIIESETTELTTDDIVEDKYIEYIIKEGDSLYSIIKTEMNWSIYNNGLKMLTEMNNIRETDILKIGSTILVPVNDIDTTNYTSYIVNEGDTLYSIASDFLPTINTETAINLLMDKNNIVNPKDITSGLNIYIPSEGTIVATSGNQTSESNNIGSVTNDSECE